MVFYFIYYILFYFIRFYLIYFILRAWWEKKPNKMENRLFSLMAVSPFLSPALLLFLVDFLSFPLLLFLCFCLLLIFGLSLLPILALRSPRLFSLAVLVLPFSLRACRATQCTMHFLPVSTAHHTRQFGRVA